MKPLYLFLLWSGLGVVFIIFELIVPTSFLLLCIGIGMVGAGLIALTGIPIWGQILTWCIVTGISLWFTYKKINKGEEPHGAYGSLYLVGRTGYVLQTIEPYKGGVVYIDGEHWRALSKNHERIDEKESVKVVDIDGSKLIVVPVKEENKP